MRVTDVRTILVTAPWRGDPFWVPGEDFWRTAALIEVETDEGITGLGETIMGYFNADVVPPLVDYYRRLLVDPALRLDPMNPERCYDELYQRSLWWGRVGLAVSVLSGIEMALWDLAGKALGKPVHALLGGAVHDRLPLYASGGTGAWPVAQTVAQAERYVSLGFRGLKIGTGMTGRPGGYTTTVTPPPYGTWYARRHSARGSTTSARSSRRCDARSGRTSSWRPTPTRSRCASRGRRPTPSRSRRRSRNSTCCSSRSRCATTTPTATPTSGARPARRSPAASA